MLISEVTTSITTALVQAANIPHLGYCNNSLSIVSALFPIAPHISFTKTLQWHPHIHEIKSRFLTMANIILHVLLSTFSKLLSNSPLNHSTLDTLGILAMSWTWQASCTCHSLYVHPEFRIYMAHSLTSFKLLLKYHLFKEAFPGPCVSQLYPLWRKEIKIKNQGTGCHKAEKSVYSVKMGSVLSEQDNTVHNWEMSPSITARVLKLQEDRFWCFHFHKMLQQGNPIYCYFPEYPAECGSCVNWSE